MTALNVIEKAIELYKAGRSFDCPLCALAKAKTEMDMASDKSLSIVEVVRQVLANDISELPSDQPLVNAREAVKFAGFDTEIATCPSDISRERSIEMLTELARKQREIS